MISRFYHWNPNLTKKVNCISFQVLHAFYVIILRDPFMWSFSNHAIYLSLANMTECFIGWLLYNSKSSILNGSASLFGEIMLLLFIIIAPRSCTTQRNFCVNPPANIPKEQDKFAGARSNLDNNKAPILPEAPIPPLVSLLPRSYSQNSWRYSWK